MNDSGAVGDHGVEQLWEQLTGLHARVEQDLTRGLRRTGLGLSEYRALAHLDASPDQEIRMLDLADLLALNQSSISRLVARLEASGYARREPCGDDRRGVYVVITDRGKAGLAAAAPEYQRLLSRALGRETGPDRLPRLAEALAPPVRKTGTPGQ